MKTVIVMINSKYVHSSLAPWCLLAGVKSYCDETVAAKVIEGTINEKTEAVAERILNEAPDMVAFCCYIWNINFVYDICVLIRRKSDAKIILGGPEVTFNPQSVLENHENVDFVLCGEGEESFAALCNKLNGENVKVNGLCYRDNGKIILDPPVHCVNEPVSPYTREYFEALNGRIAYIETSRGCPFSCAFCLSGADKGVLFYNMERVRNELLALSDSGTGTVKFVDRTFNANAERANEIISFIIDNYGKSIPENVCFHFEIDGGTLKESTLALLRSAPKGLFQLEVGLQSFNKETLKAVNRNPDTTKLVENIRRLISFENMHIHVDLIAGLPHEDLISFRESFNLLYALKPHMLQLGFLKLLHGSELRRKSDFFGCVFGKNAPYEVISTDCLSENDIVTIHNAEDALERLYNSGRFPRTLSYLIDECGFLPFDLFCEIGESTHAEVNISLDDYITLVYNFLRKNCNEAVLRDRMVCDRLASNSSGVLPGCLKIEDSRLKRIKKHICEDIVKSNGKISVAILYTENKVVYCDYKEKNKITDDYTLSFTELDQYENEKKEKS